MENIYDYEIITKNDLGIKYVEIKGFKENQFVKDVIIPSQIEGYNVRSIDYGAFRETDIETVDFPSTIVVLKSRSFFNCKKLNKVTSRETKILIQNNLKSVKDWDKYYFGQRSINSWRIDDTIGSDVFAECIKLQTVDLSNTNIYEIPISNFKGTYIRDIKFPKNEFSKFLNIVDSYQSYSLKTVEKIEFPNLKLYLSIEGELFKDSMELKQVELPYKSVVIGEPFGLHTKLINANEMEYIDVTGKTMVNWFYHDIESYITSTTLSQIPEKVFFDHPTLKDVTITKNIKRIGDKAFANCNNLEKLTIEDGAATIDMIITKGSNNILEINVPSFDYFIKSPGLFKDKAVVTFVKEGYEFKLPYKKEPIHVLQDIVLSNSPNTYNFIKKSGVLDKLSHNTKAFVGVFNKAIENENIEIIDALAKDEKIHKKRINEYIDYAKEIGSNNSLIYLMKWKNENVDLKEERKKELSEARKLMSNPDAMLREIFNFRNNKNFGLGVTYKDKSKLASIQLIDFPDKYKKENITFLPNQSLKDSGVEEVILPKKLKYIGSEAFYNCKNLREIELPAGVHIGENAFNQCGNLEKIKIKNKRLGDVGMFAFSYATSLKELDVSGGIGEIGKYAFANTGIEKLVLPKSSSIIGIGAFINCANLVDVTLPEDISQIQRRMFADCVNLKEIVLPNSVKKILTQAFLGCKNLEKIVIPSSVTQIGHDSFEGCDKLVVYVARGSEAHKIAIENDLEHEFI